MGTNPRYLLATFTATLLLLLAGGAAAQGRSFAAGHFALKIDGADAGWVQSVEGGSATADVVEQKPDPTTGYVKKHLGNIKYEEVTVQVGFSSGKALYDWITASWTRQVQRKSGSVVLADFRNVPRREVQFFNALITETAIPACDSTEKEPAYMTVKFAPELTRSVTPGGQQPPPSRASAWRPHNFRLTIDGVDTSRVSKIDSFTVKQSFSENPIGETRDYEKIPGKLEFPNLKITFAESSAQSWLAWHEDFAIRGNNDDSKERSGSLELLSPQGTVLARIRFFNLGIVSVMPARVPPNPCNAGCPSDRDDLRDVVGKMQAVLYVERMEFEAPGAPQP